MILYRAIRYSTHYLCLVPLELSLQVSQVSAVWIVLVGLGALAALTKDSAMAVVNKFANAHTTKKVRDVGAEHGMTSCTHYHYLVCSMLLQ